MATSTSTYERPWPNIAIHPGEFLGEEIEARGMTQRQLAEQMGRPVQVVNEIILGKKRVTAETALELERVLGITAHLWVRLQADYELVKARLAEKSRAKAPRRRKAAVKA